MQWIPTWTSLIPTSKSYLSLESFTELVCERTFRLLQQSMVNYSYCLLSPRTVTVISELLGGGMAKWIRAMDWNLEVPGSNPPPYPYLTLFSEVPSSTPRPRCVIRQLLSLSPAEILISLCPIICNIYLFIYGIQSPINIWHLNWVFLFFGALFNRSLTPTFHRRWSSTFTG